MAHTRRQGSTAAAGITRCRSAAKALEVSEDAVDSASAAFYLLSYSGIIKFCIDHTMNLCMLPVCEIGRHWSFDGNKDDYGGAR